MYSNIFVLLLFTLLHYLNIFFIYNKLFTYASRNLPLTIVVIFSVFLGHDDNLKDFYMPGCSVDSDKLRTSVRNIKEVTNFWQQINHPTETTFSQIRCGKNNEIPLYILCYCRCSREQNINSVLNFNYFIHIVTLPLHPQNLRCSHSIPTGCFPPYNN